MNVLKEFSYNDEEKPFPKAFCRKDGCRSLEYCSHGVHYSVDSFQGPIDGHEPSPRLVQSLMNGVVERGCLYIAVMGTHNIENVWLAVLFSRINLKRWCKSFQAR